MVKKQFINPISNDKVELDECKLPKSLNDYEGRVERIPIYDQNYVDFFHAHDNPIGEFEIDL